MAWILDIHFTPFNKVCEIYIHRIVIDNAHRSGDVLPVTGES